MQHFNLLPDSTPLLSRKYKTIGALKQASISSITQVVSRLKGQDDVRDILMNYLFINYYIPLSKSVIRDTTCLTERIKSFNNNICFYSIMNNCFNSVDIKHSKQIIPILNNNIQLFIQEIHLIYPTIVGAFFDYFMRRLICQIQGKIFNDSRAHIFKYDINDEEINNEINKIKHLLLNDDILNVCDEVIDSINNPMNVNILKKTLLISTGHSISFRGKINTEKIMEIINKIDRDTLFISNMINSFITLVSQIINNKLFVLQNPSLGFHGDYLIPSDCDLLTNNSVIEIKVKTIDTENNYLLQLLAYSALASYYSTHILDTYNLTQLQISEITVINLYTCEIWTYDVSQFTLQNMKSYLDILCCK